MTDLQLALRLHQFLDLGELVVEVEAVLVRQSIGWLDRLTRHDLLDWELDLLEIDGCLEFLAPALKTQ